MIKGAIFDLDGTLLDSMSIWNTVGETYLCSIGYEPKEDLRQTIKNMSLPQAARYCQSEYGVTLSVKEIVDGVNAMIEGYYRDELPLKPGVAAFLKRLQEAGVRMCIATATDRHLVEAALKRCGIRAYFSEIFTCSSVGHGKDEPVIYREALRHLGTDQVETVVFEDALYAVKTSKSDGFLTAAVFDAYEKEQKEVRAIADVYLIDFSDAEHFWEFASAR